MTDAYAEVVGAAHVVPGTDQGPVAGALPRLIVRPGSVAEVQAVVRAAAARGECIAASGQGAHLGLGTPPPRVDVLLRLDRLARVLDHQAADMTVTTEAGCPLPVLAETLAAAGQWLPLDPPDPARTTVGGLVAANLSGPLRASHGTARDLAIGLRVVGADGALVAGGGRVVKNVAGYDLPKLHIGALGTLGIVVEVTWKVRPRPAMETACVLPCPSADAASELALVLRDLVAVAWLEVANAGTLPAPHDGEAAVIVGLAGMPEEIAAQTAAITEHTARRSVSLVALDDGTRWRLELAQFSVQPARAIVRCGTLPASVGTVITLAERTARANGGSARCLAHASNGVVLVALDGDPATAATIAALRTELAFHGGVAIVDRAAPELKHRVGVYGSPSGGVALMRGVRQQYDPRGVFVDRPPHG